MLQGEDLLALLAKFRQIMRDPFGQFHFSLFEQNHDRSGRGDGFGQRSEIEHGIDGHRHFGWLLATQPVGFAKGDLALADDENDRTGYQLLVDAVLDDAVDRIEFGLVETDLRGGGAGKPPRWFSAEAKGREGEQDNEDKERTRLHE